jgi:hypothetical protein
LDQAAWRGEVLCPLIADIGLRRFDVVGVSRRLGALGIDGDERRCHARLAGLDQQLLDDFLGLVVFAFAKMVQNLVAKNSLLAQRRAMVRM